MRVLSLTTDAFGTNGGIAQYNRDLSRAIASHPRVDALTVVPRHGPPEDASPLPGVRQRAAVRGKLAYSLRAIAETRLGYDVIHCGHLHAAPLASAVARACGAKVWLQLHGIEAWGRPGRLVQRAAESVDLVTAVSRHTRTRFLAWCGIAPHRVKVLPNTYEEQFTPAPTSESAAARRPDAPAMLLTVSRLSVQERYKGHDLVIEALALLPPRVKYVIAGDGGDRPRLEQLARDTGVVNRVRFAGHVPDDQLVDLYRACDVFVMPSTGEGFGIVFLQAMACGKPVIAASGDGSADPLRDGAAGTLLAERSAGALSKAIEAALDGRCPSPDPTLFSRGAFDRHVHALLDGLAEHPA